MTKSSLPTDDTPLEYRNPESPSLDTQKESRFSWKNIKKGLTHPILPWSLVVILLISIAAMWIDHELDDMRRDWHSEKQRYMISHEPWHMIERKREMMENRFDQMEREMEMAFERQKKAIFAPEAIASGEYSGTRIIDGKVLSYMITLTGGVLSGNITGNNNPLLESLQNNISSLGYTTTKTEGGFSIEGNGDTPTLFELLTQ